VISIRKQGSEGLEDPTCQGMVLRFDMYLPYHVLIIVTVAPKVRSNLFETQSFLKENKFYKTRTLVRNNDKQKYNVLTESSRLTTGCTGLLHFLEILGDLA